MRGRDASLPHEPRTARLERLVEVMERWERLASKLQGRLVGRDEWDTDNHLRCLALRKSSSKESFKQLVTVRFSRDLISPHLAPSHPWSSRALRFPPRARFSYIGAVHTAPESSPSLPLAQVQESGHEVEALNASWSVLKVSSIECTSPVPTSTRASAAIVN